VKVLGQNVGQKGFVMDWYVFSGGRQDGPMSEEVLRELARTGRLRRDDYVWNASMGDDWARAASVPGLFAEARAGAPAMPPPLAAGEFAPAPAAIKRISVAAPVGRAWERMHAMLFQPFDFGKWFVLGFAAWLATLGEGRVGFNVGGSGKWPEGFDADLKHDPGAAARRMQEIWLEHGGLIVAAGATVLAVSLAIGLTLLWLRCRGKFMFLDNVVHNRTEVGLPWRVFRQHANSLFLWTAVYGLVWLTVFALLIVAGVYSVVLPVVHGQPVGSVLPVLAINGSTWLAFMIVSLYIRRFLEDFVIPIMYRRDLKATEAWSVFLGHFTVYGGPLIFYGLFYAMLYVMIITLIIVVVFATCCVAACPLLIPYIGTVALLPMPVFLRIYSLEYLAQLGSDVDVWVGSDSAPG
jgi:hypothetical protein